MWLKVKELFVGLLASKKTFLVATSIIVWVVGKVQLQLDEATIEKVVYALWVLAGGIAFQDFGKEGARIAAGENSDGAG